MSKDQLNGGVRETKKEEETNQFLFVRVDNTNSTHTTLREGWDC